MSACSKGVDYRCDVDSCALLCDLLYRVEGKKKERADVLKATLARRSPLLECGEVADEAALLPDDAVTMIRGGVT